MKDKGVLVVRCDGSSSGKVVSGIVHPVQKSPGALLLPQSWRALMSDEQALKPVGAMVGPT